MRNLKRALSLGLTATMLSGMMVAGAGAASYADVTSANNEKAIDVLKAVGVMTGDDKGNFNPDQKVTRAEMAVIMANMLDLDVDNFGSASIPFTDVPSWAVPYVAACYADGITSGTSATTYGSNDTVTTVQAALMMMKALGYFQYSSDFGADWSLATIRQASSIGLFDGIKAGSKDAMTRDEVAQLSLNTLESTMVQASKTGNDIIIGDIVIGGNVTYDEVTSGSDYAKAMSQEKKDGSFTVQLGEKLYDGNLKVQASTYDDFGRPSEKWSYKTTEIGNYAKTADASYTGGVKSKDLYSDLGLSKSTKANLTVDGNGEADFTVAKGSDTKINATGDGVITEAYVDDEGNVDIAVINVYGSEVTKVVDAKDGNAAYIKISGESDEYEAEGFKVDDVVYYTKAGNEIKSVVKAGVTEGVTVTRINGDEFTADGTTYKFNKNIASSAKGDVNVDSVLDIYTDGNGFVIDVEVSKASKDYAYVLGLKNDGYNTSGTTYAKLLLADGTVTEVELDHYISNKNNGHEAWTDALVEYTKNSKDKYTLNNENVPTSKLVTDKNVNIEKGKAAMDLGGKTYFANDKTIFLVQTGNGSSATYTSYTGIENVPNLKATAGNFSVMTKGDTDANMATVVFVSDVATSSDDIVFVLGSKAPTKVSDSDAGTYYEYKAVVNGEITTVKAKTNNVDSDTLYSSISYSDKENEIVDLDNSQKYATNAQDKDNFVLDTTATNKVEDGVLALNGGTYAVSSDVEAFEVFSDKIESGSMSDIEDGVGGMFVVKNGEIVAVFYGNIDSETPSDAYVEKVWIDYDGQFGVAIELSADPGNMKSHIVVERMNDNGAWIVLDEIDVGYNTASKKAEYTYFYGLGYLMNNPGTTWRVTVDGVSTGPVVLPGV